MHSCWLQLHAHLRTCTHFITPVSPPCILTQLLEALMVEGAIDASRRVYCPHPGCSHLLERPAAPGAGAAAQQQDAPFECPACHRTFCAACRIRGWHEVRAWKRPLRKRTPDALIP